MKVLITCETYPPVVCGVSLACQQIAEGLAKHHNVIVATGWYPGRHNKLLNGVKIEEFKIKGNMAIGIRGEKNKYLDFLTSWNGNVMLNYASQCWPTDLTMTVLNKLSFKKILLPCGYSGLTGNLKMRLIYWHYFIRLPKYLNLYDEFIYLSHDFADSKFNRSKGFNKGVVIGNGINPEEFIQARSIDFRKKYDISDRHLLLNVSNHERIKGHDFVIEAFEKVNRPDTALIIISSQKSGCFKKCQRASEHSGGSIRLLTGIPRADVISAYLSADVFLYGSEIECFPLVIIESMGAGLPFISTPCGNVSELAGGIIICDTNEMANVTERLLQNKDDRVKLGEEGRKISNQQFTWDSIVKEYEELISKVCNG